MSWFAWFPEWRRSWLENHRCRKACCQSSLQEEVVTVEYDSAAYGNVTACSPDKLAVLESSPRRVPSSQGGATEWPTTDIEDGKVVADLSANSAIAATVSIAVLQRKDSEPRTASQTRAKVDGRNDQSMPGINNPEEAAPRGIKETIVAAWRRQVEQVIKPGVAMLVEGMGTLAEAFHRQRDRFAEPVVSFMFADGRTVEVPMEPGVSPSMASSRGSEASSADVRSNVSPGKMSTVSRGSFMSYWTGDTAAEPGPRSLRLSQRKDLPLRIDAGCEQTCAPSELITPEPIGPGEVEVLLTRSKCTEASLSPWEAAKGSSSTTYGIAETDVRKKITTVTDFGLTMQLPFNDWLFRAVVDGCQSGPLYDFARNGISGTDAMRGLGEAWPNTMNFMKEIFDTPNCELHVALVSHGCVKVIVNGPIHQQNLAKHFPKVAQVLRITKSLRMRFTEYPIPLSSSAGKGKAEEERKNREALRVSYVDDAFNMRFLVCDRLLAWQDDQGEPVIQNGKVLQVQTPLAPKEDPRPEDLQVHCRVDNVKLKLSEFGCLGMGGLSLPDANLVVKVSTSPVDHDSLSNSSPKSSPKQRGDSFDASPRTKHSGTEFVSSSREEAVVANVMFRILDVSAFPVETLVRPFFDIKLMRLLLVSTFQASWCVRPLGDSGSWQMINALRVSMPRVARAFRVCFKHFASAQISESDWLKLFAHLFTALGHDLHGFEANMPRKSAPATDGVNKDAGGQRRQYSLSEMGISSANLAEVAI